MHWTFLSIAFFSLLQNVLCRGKLCFPVIGDVGGLPRPPYQTNSQKKVAALLAQVTGKMGCQFVLGVGDNFYFNGVKDLSDPRFYTTFERTYSDPALNIPWYMIAGNHDHGLNISAQILYTKVSTRWKYPDYFYSFVRSIPKSRRTVEVVVIDTTMLCWHNKRSGAPMPDVQWKWLEEKLKNSKADYLIVAGHHPVLSAGSHGNTPCLVNKLKPLLEKYDVTAYFSGHDHNLQHIKEPDSKVHYFISGSGNFVDGRMTNRQKLPENSLQFQHGLFGGFMMVELSDTSMEVVVTNNEPTKLHYLKLKPRINDIEPALTLTRVDNNKLMKPFMFPVNHVTSLIMPLVSVNEKVSVANPQEVVSKLVKNKTPVLQSNINDRLQKVQIFDPAVNFVKSSVNNGFNVNTRVNKQFVTHDTHMDILNTHIDEVRSRTNTGDRNIKTANELTYNLNTFINPYMKSSNPYTDYLNIYSHALNRNIYTNSFDSFKNFADAYNANLNIFTHSSYEDSRLLSTDMNRAYHDSRKADANLNQSKQKFDLSLNNKNMDDIKRANTAIAHANNAFQTMKTKSVKAIGMKTKSSPAHLVPLKSPKGTPVEDEFPINGKLNELSEFFSSQGDRSSDIQAKKRLWFFLESNSKNNT